MTRPTTILSIAGSDNTSGAGIQADLKTAQALGAYCLCSLTVVTSQNSKKVSKIFNVPNKILASQLKSLSEEYKIDGVKIGLVNNLLSAGVIYNFLSKFRDKVPIVIDPIFQSSNNKKFVKVENFIKINKKFSKLNPVFTPNFNEANLLIKKAKKEITIQKLFFLLNEKYNCKFVITGGDLNSKYCIDYVEVDKKLYDFKSLKKKTKSTHGTGCVFSSALTIFLARGHPLVEAIKRSKKFVDKKIDSSPNFDLQYGPVG